jgi:CHAT domain-containing protein
VPGETELKHAEVESCHVARLFGGALSERPEPATVDAVESQLDTCPVWHFACHGVHEPARPLDSRLLLADGGLDLRAILSRSGGEGRLAVLSACQTANVDGMRPDEVIGFPSALLQAGLAGVISCEGEVDDAGAMLIVLRFFEIFVRAPDVHPARALATAQEWVRTSTNADFEAAFPRTYPKPEDASPRWASARPFAAPATWVRFDYTGA